MSVKLPMPESRTYPAGKSAVPRTGSFGVLAGAICCGLAVALGAFGAHSLAGVIDQWYEAPIAARKLDNWNTAVRYQVWHGLAIMAAALLVQTQMARITPVRVAIGCYLVGILLFSGGLYLWVLTDIRGTVMIVPLGGLAFLAGWLALAISVAAKQKTGS